MTFFSIERTFLRI